MGAVGEGDEDEIPHHGHREDGHDHGRDLGDLHSFAVQKEPRRDDEEKDVADESQTAQKPGDEELRIGGGRKIVKGFPRAVERFGDGVREHDHHDGGDAQELDGGIASARRCRKS